MLKITDRSCVRYQHDSYQPPPQRWSKGEKYKETPPDTATNVAGVEITEGELYTTFMKRSPSGGRNASLNKLRLMVAKKNNRGEMMLCYRRDDGSPYGGYPLGIFLAVTQYIT